MLPECPHCRRPLPQGAEPLSFCPYCGRAVAALDATAPFDAQATLPPPLAQPGGEEASPGDVIGGFRLLKKLGAGGMGLVFEAEEVATGRRVAVKLIARQYTSSPEAIERFRNEGRLASAVSHPRCVFVLGADQHDGRPYIVMELMPGDTLRDLIDRQGPLSPAEAVVKILDVIDGLREAHALGVIHRDVKPSNCFLERDGRVKVGDFGLSKSLGSDLHLTETGKFLGTILFASPEQVRGEPVDQQTDVYSVAATLYYLLAGKAPFESSDAAGTVARIVSDPLVPLRSLRPDVPPALDAAVLRGLERQRDRRFRGLDDLRDALLPFAPGHFNPARPGWRLGAYLIDMAVFAPLEVFVGASQQANWLGLGASHLAGRLAAFAIGHIAWFLYFWLLEGIWGCSLGKRLLGLRVTTTAGAPPGLARAGLRAAVFILLGWMPSALVDLQTNALSQSDLSALDVLYLVLIIVCPLLVAAPMFFVRGYRGVHDLLTGTEVRRLPGSMRARRFSAGEGGLRLWPGPQPESLPQNLGPYAVDGALRWDGDSGVLLGRDAALGRRVWIELRPQGAPPVSEARRQVARPTRMRWLSGGESSAWRWDAFTAPSGCPAADALPAGLPLPWPDARRILEQLTEELAAAESDGTLPATLSPEQVWVQPNGRIQLLDVPVAAATNRKAAPLDLLEQVARLVLVVRSEREWAAPRRPTRTPVPEHARTIAERLLGPGRPYNTLDEMADDLRATRDLPAEVTVAMRAGQLAILTGFLCLGLMFFFGFVAGFRGMVVSAVVPEMRSVEKTLYLIDNRQVRAFVDRNMEPDETIELSLEIVAGGKTYTRANRDDLVAMLKDPELVRSIRDKQSADRRNLQSYLAGSNWAERLVWREEYGEAERLLSGDPAGDLGDFTPRQLLESVEMIQVPRSFAILFFWMGALIAAGIFPVAWTLWPVLAGPGLSYRIMGMTLVRRDGRPASRLQCVLRALLVWGPITALGWGAMALTMNAPERPWLSHAAAWLAMLLLLAYAVTALRWPARTLHDRIVGTYAVPR